MAVNVKMGVDLSGFNSGIRQGQAILKGLNAEMKATEAEFKATGNLEQKLAAQTKTLNSQLLVQKGIADQAAAALKKLDAAGVQPTDIAYQKLYATLMNAQAGMNEAQAALNALDGSQQQAASSANALATSVNGIGKKMSLDQVLNGIHSITSGLESAAQKAVQLGDTIWNSIMDSAAWSDDVGTLADRMGLTTEQVQKMRVVAGEFEAPVESMAKTWKKVKMNMSSDSDEVLQAFESIGVAVEEVIGAGKYGNITQARDYIDVFWDIGEALMNMSDASEQERIAQKLLGRSWDEMIPLFKRGREEYEAALNSVEAADDETIRNNAALKDSVSALEEQFNIFKADVLGNISPELTKVTETFSGLLSAITEYINKPEGQELLSGIGDAIGSLVDDIAKIDPAEVVNGFVSVVNGLVDGLKWIVENKDTLVTAMKVVVAGWAGLKLTGGILTIVKLIDGLKDLGLIGGGSTAAEAGGGVSWASKAMSTASQAVANYLGNPVLQSVLPVIGDWFTYNSTIGHWLMGTETPADTLEGIKQNASTFQKDWEENNLLKPFIEAGKNTIMFWDQFWKGSGALFTPENMEEANWLPSYMQDQTPEIQVEPVAPEDAAESIASQIGVVQLPAHVYVSTVGGAGAGGGKFNYLAVHANGLPYVPYDGYLAQLHRGERVLTASENKSYTYNSNNYFGNVNLNNGQDIEALCDSIDRHNRRQRSGYGS